MSQRVAMFCDIDDFCNTFEGRVEHMRAQPEVADWRFRRFRVMCPY
jgi:hypothetical protein